jgi:hypothetical protein
VVLASVADAKLSVASRPNRVRQNLKPAATVTKKEFVAGESAA